jgi:hypothetical protein
VNGHLAEKGLLEGIKICLGRGLRRRQLLIVARLELSPNMQTWVPRQALRRQGNELSLSQQSVLPNLVTSTSALPVLLVTVTVAVTVRGRKEWGTLIEAFIR